MMNIPILIIIFASLIVWNVILTIKTIKNSKSIQKLNNVLDKIVDICEEINEIVYDVEEFSDKKRIKDG